ncbi:Fc.00g078720.m01.CDS01 [Cosmosporella sp. VM-42]
MAARWMRQRALTAVVLASVATAHNFPYVPTQILMPNTCTAPSLPCDGSDIAYVFSQTDDGVSFRELNFSATINLDLQLDTVTDTLPFLEDKPATTAFGATRTANGTLLVYAGDCDGGAGDVWSFNQEDAAWAKRDMGDDGAGPRGPYFLGGTMAFSSTLAPTMDQPTIYTYGGMCVKPDTDAKTWQQDANYTKSMLSIEPTSEKLDTGYTLSVASNSGPRTPIAGFTFTPLTPSMTNKSGIVTQQASYVLLGGQTSQAFINMSTAAVWNLPAESWTYVNVQAPDTGRDGTELALANRATAVDNVYSRSGHTAVLSEDGGSVVVMGGWVGDVGTPAEPQLAVLDMSETYSSWQWKIPDDQPSGNGVYGHGAAVLPGNVMIVYGGWEIGSLSSKRQAPGTSTPRFLNLTSMTWTSSYTNPAVQRPSTGDPDAPKEGGHPDTKKLGLGLGLGFGFAILLAAVIIGFYWYKKHNKHRESREQAVRALSQDPSQYLEHDEMLEREDDPWGPGGWYSGGQDPYQNGERSLGYETLRGNRGGAFSGPEPGLHIPRKPITRQQRGGYVPTAQRPTSFVAVPGQIHPIYEDDEEESYHQNRSNREVQTPTSEEPSDPFLTPTAATAPPLFPPGSRGSSTPSPEGRRHDPEVQDWVSDVDAADAMLARMNTRGHGRVSPTRRGSHRSAALRDDESRSGSNLSESTKSVTESLKGRKPNPLVPMALFSGSKEVEHQKPGSSSSSSYNTARSSFGALQAEGPSLLLGRNVAPSPNNYDDEEPPSSPSKSKPRRGWLGSLRRVFSNSESTTPTSSREDVSQRDHDLGIGGGDYEPGLVGLRGELLRRKQGRQDWEEGAAGESDWDIERAVEQRLVQVMFTVPRERLRVVNADDEDGEEEEREGMVQPLSAVLVDPEMESQRTESGLREKRSFREEEEDLREKQVEEREDLDDPEEFDEKQQEEEEPEQHHHHHTRQDSRDLTHHRPRPLHIPPSLDYHVHSRNTSQEINGAFLSVDTNPLEPSFSHETDDTGRRSSGVVMEAQAMPLTRERPRTRVLQMVDSFETMSREGSPTRSV